MVLVEQKSAGRDLRKAKAQALDYFPGLKDADLPRYILLSDFQTFELYDLEEDDEIVFSLADLPGHVEKFGFILGVQKRSFKDQDPVNIEASELVGALHDALEEAGYTRTRSRAVSRPHRVLPVRRRHRHFRAARHLSLIFWKAGPARTVQT